MSFKDVIKESVLKVYNNGGLSFWEVLVVLLVACAIGVYIYFIYRLLSKSSFYSLDINITMAGMVVVTAAIMVAMQSNLIVSLGMVGALSIVRFRSAIKNPLDLLYMFWAISEGIICGVRLYLLSVLLCVFVTVLLILLRRVRGIKAPYVLVVKTTNEVETTTVYDCLKGYCSYCREKALMCRDNEVEIIYEIKIKDEDGLLKRIRAIHGVLSVGYMDYDGEMRV